MKRVGRKKEAYVPHYPGLFFSFQICDFETGYPAADGMRQRRLPGLSLVEHTHTLSHAHTCRVCTYPLLEAHLLRISSWDGTEAGSVAAALLFTSSSRDKRRKEGNRRHVRQAE